MAEFRHVKRIMVSLWGERVGTIVPMDSRQETFAFLFDNGAFPHVGSEGVSDIRAVSSHC